MRFNIINFNVKFNVEFLTQKELKNLFFQLLISNIN